MRCRGRAVPSRRCTDDSYWVSIKTHKPIASVAALTAQPLAALPPYGCGVPLAGSERLWQLQILWHEFIGAMPPSLSLRGRIAPVAISRNWLRFRRGLPVIRPGTARFPRRFAPRNDTSGSAEVHQSTSTVEYPPARRSVSAATDAIGAYRFNGGLCELAVLRRAGHAPPLH